MEAQSQKNVATYSLLLALVISLFDYFYLFLTQELGLTGTQIATGSYSIVAPRILDFLGNYFQALPLIAFWVLAGTIAYLFYFLLFNVYYNFHYFFEIKKIPYEGLLNDNQKVRILATRLVTHILVIALCLFFLIATYLLIVPLSRYTYAYLAQINPFPQIPIELLGPLAVWFIVFRIYFFFTNHSFVNLKNQKFWQEHDLTQ